MTNDPRHDPAQQPRDPSVNPDNDAPVKDPAQEPKDPCIKSPSIDPGKNNK